MSARLTAPELQTRLRHACDGARRWTRGKTLAEAWRTCHVGGWMAWWLHCYQDVSNVCLVNEARQVFNHEDVGPSLPVYLRGTRKQDRLWANYLREHYNYDGTRRTK